MPEEGPVTRAALMQGHGTGRLVVRHTTSVAVWTIGPRV